MSGIFRSNNIIRMALIMSLATIMGCSSGDEFFTFPTETVTRSFSSIGETLTYEPLDTRIYVPPDLVEEGESGVLAVRLTPPNLPENAYAGNTFSRIGWLNMQCDLELHWQDELVVTIPLIKEFNPNVMYSVFNYDYSLGKWIKTARNATVTDNGTHAIFSADSFGTWGVFEAEAYKVEAHASRTTAKAPASVSLKAVIKGGAPPYCVVWYFGDGSEPKGGHAVSHWFEFPGKYTATCVVTDNAGRVVSSNIDLNWH